MYRSFFFVFFKQKTAYEMRISDWSSDVCSSDLSRRTLAAVVHPANDLGQDRPDFVSRRFCATTGFAPDRMMLFGRMRSEERRVGKECVRRVDLGGRRIIKKKHRLQHYRIELCESRSKPK